MTRHTKTPEAPMCHVDDAMVVHMFGDTPRTADRFPELAPQEPIGLPVTPALVLMFAGAGAIIVLGVVGSWALGVM